VLTITVLALADWTFAASSRIRIEAAARAASAVAIAAPADSGAIAASIRAAAPDLPALSVAEPRSWCECAAVPIDCSAICAGGLQRFIRVGASLPYARMSPIGPTEITGHVTLRLP
jgi:hypothetical protein